MNTAIHHASHRSADNLGAGCANSVRHRFTRAEKLLLLIFLLTLPFANPLVRGDGVGYYAFARSMVIGHNLDFRPDWLAANASYRMGRVDEQNRILPEQYTATGHLNNHFSIGPAILWAPFLLAAHASVLAWDKLGGRVAADGYSMPYLWAMAIGTAIYGFLALWISFRVARKYFSQRWALLATLGIWFASSLPVYMYLNPSWPHALSAFTVALFVWYWNRTRGGRSWKRWVLLGTIGGLVMDVYYLAAIVMLLPLLEILSKLRRPLKGKDAAAFVPARNIAFFFGSALLFFLPTLVSKRIIYGHLLSFGYNTPWNWRSPAFLRVLLSADHGLLSWTPILILALLGLVLLRKRDRELATLLLIVFGIFLYVMGSYPDWTGISSFGNRFFVSLTPLFVLGLAALFSAVAQAWNERRTWLISAIATLAFAAWNCGLIFQWGAHLIPVRGPISWREAAANQVLVVPVRAAGTFEDYMTGRRKLMQKIEQIDMKQLRASESNGSE